MESSKQIEDRAAAWLARRDSARWSEADQRELADWLQADTAHRVAFLRLEAGWEKSARLKAFGAAAKSGGVPPAGEWRASAFFERRPGAAVRASGKAHGRRFAAIAAGVVVVLATAIYFSSSQEGVRYSTPVGGVASIPLRDGSLVTLNTSSRIRVVLTDAERRIELENGEAFFDVAKDARRPFVVKAGNRNVVAVGTQFAVRRDGADVQVVVTDGKVRVEQTGGHGGGGLLTAGAVARIDGQAIHTQNKTLHEVEEALSWRSGYLAFDETSLANAVAEFNRYSPRKIRIDDPQLAALRINGKFRSTNADDFILLLRNGFNIRARARGEAIVLSAN